MSEEPSQIDFDHLKLYVGDDPALIAEVFDLFKNQVDMWSPKLQRDLDDVNWAMMTHSLKGTSRAIGANSLGAMCEEAETLVGEGRRSGSRTVMIEKIENAISLTMMEIQRWEYRQTIQTLKS